MPTEAQQERLSVSLEPNPAEWRGITSQYLTELADYLLAESRWGRGPGLLALPARRGNGVPVMTAPELLGLHGITALGENGYAIVSWPGSDSPRVKSLDLRSLPPGDHLIYACLAAERVPCGESLPTRRPGTEGPGRALRYRAARVALAAEGQRDHYLDWLPVARVVRERGAASIRTRLDDSFHPPVTDLQAWSAPLPLGLLVDRGLQALDGEPETSLRTLARLELIALRNVSGRGDPQVAFLQTQRCIALLRACQLARLILPGDIEQVDYAPCELWRFFAMIAEALQAQSSREPLPPQVSVAGVAYQRLAGEFVRDGAVWRWDAPRSGFRVNGMALYFPFASLGELPIVKCGRLVHEANGFPLATEAAGLAEPGTALLLDQVTNAVDRVLLTVASPAEAVRFEQKLNQGHGLYYY